MPVWSPLLLNGPAEIQKYFSLLGIYIEQPSTELIQANCCITISSWHQDKTIHWLDNLKSLRRIGSDNPVILLSFLPEVTIKNQILFSHEGIYFLRLPFTFLEFNAIIASIDKPNNLILNKVQDQLCYEHIYSSWINLRHGKPGEMINVIFVPLRMSLLLDLDPNEKLKVIQQIVNGPVSTYWQSPIMQSIRKDAEKLKDNGGLETIIHNFFNDLNELFATISYHSILANQKMVRKIDELIFTFNKIDKSLS